MTAKNCDGRFTIRCNGRDFVGNVLGELLENPVTVQIRVYKRPRSNDISTMVSCPYLGGAHEDMCTVINRKPGFGEDLRGVCPYSVDLPYTVDNAYNSKESPRIGET